MENWLLDFCRYIGYNNCCRIWVLLLFLLLLILNLFLDWYELRVLMRGKSKPFVPEPDATSDDGRNYVPHSVSPRRLEVQPRRLDPPSEES